MKENYSDAYQRVAPILTKHPKGEELLERLRWWEDHEDEPDQAGWNTAETVYWLSYNWHGGQDCPLYAAGSATEFKPGPMSGVELETTAHMIYDELDQIMDRRTHETSRQQGAQPSAEGGAQGSEGSG